jgi:S-adenosyl methyltransferase
MPLSASNDDNVRIVSSDPLLPFEARKPSIARAYDYALGGKDNFAADRELVAKMQEVFPLGGVLSWENRQFLARAVDYVSTQGVLQFIDVGSGLPTSPSTHEVAGQVDPQARVVYVDNDPIVISHAAALSASRDRVAAIPGDVRRPDAILADSGLTAMIDLGKPFCVILGMILDFVEPAAAADLTAVFRRAMPPGSFLIISIGINNNTPEVAKQVIETYTAGMVHVHSREQIAGYFAGLEIVEPGLTEARYWRPPPEQANAGSRTADVLAGVGRKPPAS